MGNTNGVELSEENDIGLSSQTPRPVISEIPVIYSSEEPVIYSSEEIVESPSFNKYRTNAQVQAKLLYEPSAVVDILSFPSEWTSYSLDTGYVNMSLSSPEGKSIQKFFERTSSAKDFVLKITKIARIENPFLHSLYLLKKEEMATRNRHVDEVFLYHGTKRNNLFEICEENLNWRVYSDSHKFGKGISFSPSATYSSHYSNVAGEKVMLLFKVLISRSINGSPEIDIPFDESGVPCDTSIKDDTSVIVKYSDNEFYPLYKITYTKLDF